MRLWSTRAASDPTPVGREDAVISAVDAALGFVAGQRWVPRHTAIALLETVRDVRATSTLPSISTTSSMPPSRNVTIRPWPPH